MITRTTDQATQELGTTLRWKVSPLSMTKKADPRLNRLLKDLSKEIAWGDRQNAAKKLGYLGNPDALPGLLTALQNDNFWMVRCAIIQALERIGDTRSVPVLREIANQDSFQAVRSYAARAIERLL